MAASPPQKRKPRQIRRDGGPKEAARFIAEQWPTSRRAPHGQGLEQLDRPLAYRRLRWPDMTCRNAE